MLFLCVCVCMYAFLKLISYLGFAFLLCVQYVIVNELTSQVVSTLLSL